MKVLLSAYACEPGKGSEPGVGWHWAIEIARRGHQVKVLTRANNRANIEAGIAADPCFPANIEFAYYDLPQWLLLFKRRCKAVRLYYALWQVGAFRHARRLHAEKGFDLVHHVTFVTVRNFSLMGRLGIPFVLGPLAGGETSPFWLRRHIGWRGGLADTVRDMANLSSRFDLILKGALAKSKVVAVTTPQTQRLIPKKYREKTRCILQIGIDKQPNNGGLPQEPRVKRIVYSGRFIYWKGMRIGLDAFAKALKQDPALQLTMVGKGPEEECWRRHADSLGVADRIDWVLWLPQAELMSLYAGHGVLLFPSLHDSGGQVVLEALSCGLPVVCLKLGGPGEIVNENCGCAIPTDHRDYGRLTDEMAQALLHFTESPETWREASLRALKEAKKWSWAARVESLGVY